MVEVSVIGRDVFGGGACASPSPLRFPLPLEGEKIVQKNNTFENVHLKRPLGTLFLDF